jgi:outer membrane cobalamin receptor
LRADYRLDEHVLFFVAAENLLDYDYEFRPGYPMPGVSVMGGIQLTFSGGWTKA